MIPSSEHNNPRIILAAMYAQHNVHAEQVAFLSQDESQDSVSFVSSRTRPYAREMTSLFTRLLAVELEKYDVRKNALVGKGRHSIYKLSSIDLSHQGHAQRYRLHLDKIGFVLRHLHELLQ